MGNCTTQHPHHVKLYNEELSNTKAPGFTSIYRTPNNETLTESPFPEIKTYKDVLLRTREKYGLRDGLGRIKLEIKGKDQDGKDIEERTVEKITYSQGMKTAEYLGRALIKNKLSFTESEQKMNLLGIHSKNRLEWFITDWACVFFNIVSVPLYDTLGIQNLSYCLNQTQLTTIFSSPQTIKTILSLKDRGNLQNIISYDKLDGQTEKLIGESKIKLWYYDDLIEEGKNELQIKIEDYKVSKEDIYTFSYTSGTTGPPKGVLLTHKNMTSLISAVNGHPDPHLSQKDVHISYLPLPHSFQRGITPCVIFNGGLIVSYGGNNLKLKDDCIAVKPTLFFSVPRIFNKIVEVVKNKFEEKTGVSKWLIDKGVESKLEKANQQAVFKNTIYDTLVFDKVKDGFGGNIRLMLSGSAPIIKQTQVYMQILMQAPLIEGYGQTQNAAAAFITLAKDPHHGYVGGIIKSLQFKLSDIPEMQYTAEDKNSEGLSSPRGELWIRGPQVFAGYYKMKQKTEEAITPDGWLKTGDIAQILPQNKALKIIDRKKNIFKLAQGQYVASEKVEAIYSKSPYVAEVFLHGQSTKNYSIVIIVPHRKEIEKAAIQANIEGNFEELCKNLEIKKRVLEEINAVGKENGLFGFQMANNIFLDHQNFQQRDVLTNTMKLMRFQAKKYYKNEIDKMYEQGEILKSQPPK